MKKLLAAGCCILAFQSLSRVTSANEALDHQNGRKVLIKALAVIANSESARKAPPKRIHIPNVESPRA